MLAGLRIPAVDEVAGAEFGAGNAGDHHAVGDQRRDRHRIAGLEVDRVLAPQLLAGLGVERDDIGIERGAEDLAVIDRGAAVDDAAADDARRLRRIFDLGLPDLLAGLGVDRHRGAVGGDVQHALVDQRLRFLAAIVVEAVVPDRHQALDGVLVDLLERAETLQIVAHAVIENVVGVGRALRQFVGRLCHRGSAQIASPTRRPMQCGLHWSSSLGARLFAAAIAVRDVSLPYLLSLNPVPARAWEKRPTCGRQSYTTQTLPHGVKQTQLRVDLFALRRFFGAARFGKIGAKPRANLFSGKRNVVFPTFIAIGCRPTSWAGNRVEGVGGRKLRRPNTRVPDIDPAARGSDARRHCLRL